MKQKEALRRRQQLAADLPPLTEILRGSLLQRTIRHKKGCTKCERGGGHPVWVLTIGYAGGILARPAGRCCAHGQPGFSRLAGVVNPFLGGPKPDQIAGVAALGAAGVLVALRVRRSRRRP
jgi:hypothetical protein